MTDLDTVFTCHNIPVSHNIRVSTTRVWCLYNIKKKKTHRKQDTSVLLSDICCWTQFYIWCFTVSTLMHRDMVAIETMLTLTGFLRQTCPALTAQTACTRDSCTAACMVLYCVYVPVCALILKCKKSFLSYITLIMWICCIWTVVW